MCNERGTTFFSFCSGIKARAKSHSVKQYEDMTHIEKRSSRRQLYTDKSFPPNDTSLFGSAGVVGGCTGCYYIAKWLRPKEITENAWGCLQNCSQFLTQGNIGNCFFIASIALIRNTKYYKMVMPKKIEFDSEDYDGSFTFRFWWPQKNDWVDVKIDDCLPTCRLKLFFGRADDPNDFSVPLLEKAYIKFLMLYIKDRKNCLLKYDSYKSVDGGNMAEALNHLTGRPSIHVNIPTIHNFADYLIDHFKRGNMMGCFISTNKNIPAITTDGLVNNHAYSIIDVVKKPIPMVKLLNPWGRNPPSWNGLNEYGTGVWHNLAENLQNSFHRCKGELIMSIDEMGQRFTHLAVCSTGKVANAEKGRSDAFIGVIASIACILIMILSLVITYVLKSTHVTRHYNYADAMPVG